MAYNGNYTIDGKVHRFDINGKWLGEVTAKSIEGWNYENGGWRYYISNYPVFGRIIYDGGHMYAIDANGFMISNAFYSSFYFGADGKKANYSGWKAIKGNWVYFDDAGCVCTGWINDGGDMYYVETKYDDNMPEHTNVSYKYRSYAMVTGIKNVNGKLYYFGGDGKLVSEVKTDGWYKVNDSWFYVRGGKLVRNESNVNIGGQYYAFYDSGAMVSGTTYGGAYYLESGVKANAGWHWVEYEENKYGWIYVYENGQAATNGIHLIGGVEYAFKNDIWVA
jgi:glucan-binding YG repeat protein